jgi:hypothetical protein
MVNDQKTLSAMAANRSEAVAISETNSDFGLHLRTMGASLTICLMNGSLGLIG